MVKTRRDKWLWVQWNSGDQSVINFSELVSLPDKAAVGQLVIAERNCKYEAASILAASRNRERLERKLAEAELREKQILEHREQGQRLQSELDQEKHAEEQMQLETKVQLELIQTEEAQSELEIKQAGGELPTQREPQENSEAETEHLDEIESQTKLKKKNERDDNESDDEDLADFSASDSDWKPDEEKLSSDDEVDDREINSRAMQRFYWKRRCGRVVKPRYRAEAINVTCSKNRNDPISNTVNNHDTTKTQMARVRCCCKRKSSAFTTRKHSIPSPNQMTEDIMRNFRKLFCLVQKIKPRHWQMTRKEQICNAIKLAWVEAMWEKFVAEKHTKQANHFDDINIKGDKCRTDLTKENNTKKIAENCEDEQNPICTCACKIHSESKNGNQNQEIQDDSSKNQLLVTKKNTKVYKNNNFTAKHDDKSCNDSTMKTMYEFNEDKEIENERNQSDCYDTEDELNRSDDDVLISNKYKFIHHKQNEIQDNHQDESEDEKIVTANHEEVCNEKENINEENDSNETNNANDHNLSDDNVPINNKYDLVVPDKNKKVLAEHNQRNQNKRQSQDKIPGKLSHLNDSPKSENHDKNLNESSNKVLVNNKVYKNKNKRILVEDNDDQIDCKRKRIIYVEHSNPKNTKIENSKNKDDVQEQKNQTNYNETEQESEYIQGQGHKHEAEKLMEIHKQENKNQVIQRPSNKDRGTYKINNRKKKKGKPNKQQEDSDWIPIGSGKTMLHKDEYRKVNWKSYTIATRTLLLAVFDRKTLATHSLTGKKSPAFQDKPAKLRLDPKLVSDIIIEIVDRFDVKENLVRSIITTKCADECKMARMQQKRLSVPANRDFISDGEDDANRTL